MVANNNIYQGNTMNKKLIAASLLAAAPLASQADILGAHAGAYVWQQKWSGDVRANGDSLDVERDLGYDDDSGSSFYVALEHPIIFIPELRLQRTELEISERNDFQRRSTLPAPRLTSTIPSTPPPTWATPTPPSIMKSSIIGSTWMSASRRESSTVRFA